MASRCLKEAMRNTVGSFRSFQTASNFNANALETWAATPKELVLKDALRPEHLASLYVTLPTRAEGGTFQPQPGTPLGYGHHLVFFHQRNPEALLRADGTDADFCPPEPFTRRMWAGGHISWNATKPLIIGRNATARTTVQGAVKKGFETGNPMLFVKQFIDITMDEEQEPSVREERTHVYLPTSAHQGPADAKHPRPVSGLVSKPEFSYQYTPTPTTLFRFSALTFNGHHIHLDKEYAQQAEGYSERLVHGPLTALMLLEVLVNFHPNASIKSFEYRAHNPLTVNQSLTIHGAWIEDKVVKMWCTDKNDTVGMTGTLSLC